jgi:hypothetical protein
MKDVNELNVEIERVKGDIKLIQQSLHNIETNHLVHLQASIDKTKRILWTVGFMIFGQLVLVLKSLLVS